MGHIDAERVASGIRVSALVASSHGQGRGRGVHIASPLASNSNTAD